MAVSFSVELAGVHKVWNNFRTKSMIGKDPLQESRRNHKDMRQSRNRSSKPAPSGKEPLGLAPPVIEHHPATKDPAENDGGSDPEKKVKMGRCENMNDLSSTKLSKEVSKKKNCLN
jgi:hypothetical protein